MLVPIAPGFEEIETITVVDILRRLGAKVSIVGTIIDPIEDSRGVRVVLDEHIDDINPKILK